MVLICNSRDGVTEAITHMEQNNIGGSNVIPSMLSHSKILWEDLNNSDRRLKIREDLANIERS